MSFCENIENYLQGVFDMYSYTYINGYKGWWTIVNVESIEIIDNDIKKSAMKFFKKQYPHYLKCNLVFENCNQNILVQTFNKYLQCENNKSYYLMVENIIQEFKNHLGNDFNIIFLTDNDDTLDYFDNYIIYNNTECYYFGFYIGS